MCHEKNKWSFAEGEKKFVAKKKSIAIGIPFFLEAVQFHNCMNSVRWMEFGLHYIYAIFSLFILTCHEKSPPPKFQGTSNQLHVAESYFFIILFTYTVEHVEFTQILYSEKILPYL